MYSEMKDWDMSGETCMTSGNGDLASITSKPEQDFILDTFPGAEFWIGLQQEVSQF